MTKPNHPKFEELPVVAEDQVEPGDLLFVRSKGLIAKIILAAEGASDGSEPTHVATVVSRNPALVSDCISPRIVIQPLAESLKGVESAQLFRLKDNKDGAVQMARMAAMSDGVPYGYWSLYLMAWRCVIGAKPGKKSHLWFRVVFALLLPLLFPLFAMCWLRETAEHIFNGSLMLPEGAFLLFLGIGFLHSSLHNPLIIYFCVYLWLGWIMFLELRAKIYRQNWLKQARALNKNLERARSAPDLGNDEDASYAC